MPSEVDSLVQRLESEGREFTDKRVIVGKKERSPANVAKIDAIKGILDIIDEDEVDKFFLENMALAERLEYRLTAEPMVLLQKIDRAYAQQDIPI